MASEVSMNKSNLKRFISEIGELSYIEKIKIREKKITSIEAKTFTLLESLEVLWLDNNQIEYLDANAIGHLTKLRLVNLENNKLKRIEANTFTRLESIEELNLYNNQIEYLDANAIGHLTKLRWVNLENNKLKRIEANTFTCLETLERLSLENNQIEYLDANAIGHLTKLTRLDLSNNKLKRIEAFTRLESLERLLLSNNEIEYLDGNAIGHLTKLSSVWLENNKLNRIDKTVFSGLQTIGLIKLTSNPFETRILSFFNKNCYCLNSFQSVQEIEEILKKNGGFESKWESFLGQFATLQNPDAPEDHDEERETNTGPISKFIKIQTNPIGEGAYGKVYLVEDTTKNKILVMKQMKKTSDSVEAYLLDEISHENIVRYYEHFDHKIENIQHTCIILEYCEKGDLRKQIKASNGASIPKRKIFDWIHQAANALKYLHRIQIIHRDIKPENMLLKQDGILKIGEMGGARKFNTQIVHTNSFKGTIPYMSPEAFGTIYRRSPYSFKTDVWSLGCVLFELLFKNLAFPLGPRDDVRHPDISRSGIFRTALSKMLERDETERWDSKKVFTHLTVIEDDIDS